MSVVFTLGVQSTKPTDHPNDEQVSYQTDYDLKYNLHCGYILHHVLWVVNLFDQIFLSPSLTDVWQPNRLVRSQSQCLDWLFLIRSICV
jgi:hypothetical protein